VVLIHDVTRVGAGTPEVGVVDRVGDRAIGLPPGGWDAGECHLL